MSAPVEKAAQEVIAGDPRDSARAWLWPLTVAVAIIFAMDTYLVATQPLLPFDVPVATFIQSFPWGPVTYIFDAINYTAGYLQVAVGVAAVVILFLVERRAGYLMAIGSISSLLDNLIKLAMARQRPAADLEVVQGKAPARPDLMLGSDVVAFCEVRGQGEGGIQLLEQPAFLQGPDDQAGADLVVSPDPAHRPPEQEVEASSQQVQEADGLPDLAGRVGNDAVSRRRVQLVAHTNQVILVVAVFRERTPHDAAHLGLDQHVGSRDKSGMTPVRIDGIASAKSPLLSEADESRDQVVAVGEDEVARRQPAGFLARTESLRLRHLDAITPRAA